MTQPDPGLARLLRHNRHTQVTKDAPTANIRPIAQKPVLQQFRLLQLLKLPQDRLTCPGLLRRSLRLLSKRCTARLSLLDSARVEPGSDTDLGGWPFPRGYSHGLLQTKHFMGLYSSLSKTQLKTKDIEAVAAFLPPDCF